MGANTRLQLSSCLAWPLLSFALFSLFALSRVFGSSRTLGRWTRIEGLYAAGRELAAFYREVGVAGGGGGVLFGLRIDHVLHAIMGSPTTDQAYSPRRTVATLQQPLMALFEVAYADVLLPLLDTVRLRTHSPTLTRTHSPTHSPSPVTPHPHPHPSPSPVTLTLTLTSHLSPSPPPPPRWRSSRRNGR